MALLNLFLILGYRSEAAILGLSLGFTVLLVAATLWMELSVRRAQAALTETAQMCIRDSQYTCPPASTRRKHFWVGSRQNRAFPSPIT